MTDENREIGAIPRGWEALGRGDWEDARAHFTTALEHEETPTRWKAWDGLRGAEFTSHNDDELVEMVQNHAKTTPGKRLSREEIPKTAKGV